MKKILIILPLLVLFTGCKKYLDVNHNVDGPSKIDGYLYLAGIEQAYEGIYYDIRAIGPLTQMMGTTSYTSFATHTYSAGSDAGGEIWRVVYWLQGMNLENMINQSVAAEDWTLAGIGYAIKAYSWDMMTKVHCDLPLQDAFVPGLLSHRYDYQDSIYPKVREWAYKAIELLQKDDNHQYGSKISANDFIYRGDKTKWIKFAYAVIVRNLASLSNKVNFTSDYAQELITAASKSFQSSDDDATLTVQGGSQTVAYSDYNNYWGTAYRGTTAPALSYSYFQHEYAVQVFTGTVPRYDEATGNKTAVTGSAFSPYELSPNQIITDTLINVTGHWDPRVAVKLATASYPNYTGIDNIDSIKAYKYYGGSFTSATGPIGIAPSFYGRNASATFSGTVHDGIGRWLYRDNAPYILTTCSEIKLCLAEALFKTGRTAEAFQAFKEGVSADMDFTAKYIYPGTKGSPTGGDKITKNLFTTYAQQYLAGPFVAGLSLNNFSLSHIMMQKFIALYPWGAPEVWVDERKYNYDIRYTGDYPKQGNGWTTTTLDQKWDSDPTKVYKGFYLSPAQVQSRRVGYSLVDNQGSPEYRLRPRYNSEYMWNKKSLDGLLPISGLSPIYQTSIPWFAYPKGWPK